MAKSPLMLPFQLVLLMFAGWVNRHQLDVLEYLRAENRVLKVRLGGRRIRFTDIERRRLARKAQALGRKVLNDLETLVTADTLGRAVFEASDTSFWIEIQNTQTHSGGLPGRAPKLFACRRGRRI
jgi:hypothetical protein